jgi:hypothetical protein
MVERLITNKERVRYLANYPTEMGVGQWVKSNIWEDDLEVVLAVAEFDENQKPHRVYTNDRFAVIHDGTVEKYRENNIEVVVLPWELYLQLLRYLNEFDAQTEQIDTPAR